MKQKIGKSLSILLAVVITAGLLLTLTGCGKSESAVTTSAPSPASNTSSSTDALKSTTEATYTTPPKKILGIIIDNEANDFSESNVIDLCAALGLNFDDYDEWHFYTATASTAGEMAERLMRDYACTDLIFAAKGSADIAEVIRYDYPDVTVYVTESAKVVEPKLVATYNFAFRDGGKFQNGLAWCTYTENGDKWLAVINEDFKIIYKTLIDNRMASDDYMEDGYAYYGLFDGENNWEYVIIDKEGNELYRTKNTEDTKYSICGHGDGVFILKKRVENFAENAVYISMINANGEIVFNDQEIESDFSTDFIYYGEGIFRSYDGSIAGIGGFANSNTGAVFKEYTYGDEFLTSFDDGEAYFRVDGVKGGYAANVRWITTVVTPDVFASESSFRAWRDALSPDDNKVERFTPELSYQDPIKVTGIGYGSGGYYPVQLKGADGNAYFTIVDKYGVQQYEPIKYPGFEGVRYGYGTPVGEKLDARFVDGIFTYEEDGEWYVVFPDGTKTQISEIKTAKYFNTFDGTYLYLYNSFNSDNPWSVVNVLTGEVHDKIYLYDDLEAPRNNTVITETTKAPAKTYITPSSFTIEGKWKNVGDYTFGQVQAGAIVAFDGTNCNVYSPKDTYAFYKDGDNYKLECTSLLFSDTLTFTVKIVDEEHIDIYNGSNYLEMTRVN